LDLGALSGAGVAQSLHKRTARRELLKNRWNRAFLWPDSAAVMSRAASSAAALASGASKPVVNVELRKDGEYPSIQAENEGQKVHG
jgi:hypothetical protein